ncbi:MAG TPA: hypothetical protein VLA76_12260 [Candidatus Angelobacter sp.]|nr:hypothetical protein [Candidatus Angelobacter sp.]
MTSAIRARLTGASTYLLLVALTTIAIAACGGSTAAAAPVDPVSTPESSSAPAAPAASGDLLEDLEEASEAFEEFIDTDNDGLNDIEGEVDPDDGSGDAAEGQVDPDNGFIPTLYVDGDDLGRILRESPHPDCSHSSMVDGDACTWTTGDGSASLGVEIYRDPNLATREAYVAHMETLMSSGSPIDDLGEAAFSGRNPLGPGARVTVFLGDGVHLWVTIVAEGDEAVIADQALELASKIVAMQ